MTGPAEGRATAGHLRPFAEALARVPTRQGHFERGLRLLVRAFSRIAGWRIDVSVTAPLPRRDGVAGAGCLVAAAPHRAWLEPFLLAAAWPSDAARLVWLADARTVTRSRWRRRFLPRLGVIPVSAGAGGPSAYAELVAAACARGHAVVVFPEVGPPSAPERTRRISPGFAYLALRAGAPVVPVVIGGTHHIVRGSAFSLDILPALESGPAVADPFNPSAQGQARSTADEFGARVAAILPERTRQADARAPRRDQWRWLATLFG